MSTDELLDRDAIFAVAYKELRRLAHSLRLRDRGFTLNTTGLVHEAYLKLHATPTARGYPKEHLMGIVAKAMRHILVDAARRRNAQKRGGGVDAISFDEAAGTSHTTAVTADQIEALNAALEELESISERQAKLIELRFFSGFTVEETASILGISRSTVEKDWRFARAWLTSRLAGR